MDIYYNDFFVDDAEVLVYTRSGMVNESRHLTVGFVIGWKEYRIKSWNHRVEGTNGCFVIAGEDNFILNGFPRKNNLTLENARSLWNRLSDHGFFS